LGEEKGKSKRLVAKKRSPGVKKIRASEVFSLSAQALAKALACDIRPTLGFDRSCQDESGKTR
jgi:hypothetical protein